MKLFVGLGNPGAKYARNRHNVGFMTVERIASAHGAGPWRKKFQGLVSEATIAGEKTLLLKPDTFMNESGRSVGEAVRFLKLPIGDVVVFYDEIDLAPGKLKVKVGGGNAGHNGLRSISAHLDNEYARVRIGVGHPGHKDLVAQYVLGDFAKADQPWLEPLLDAIAKSASRLVMGNSERFLTDVARELGVEAAQNTKGDDKAGKGRAAEDNADVPANARGGHPAGERAGKRQSALAENLRKWMEGRRKGNSE